MQLSDNFPSRYVFEEFLAEYAQCETHWYFIKWRVLNRTKYPFELQKILIYFFDKLLGKIWNKETQKELYDYLNEQKLLNPYKKEGSIQDKNANIRIIKKHLETLGVLYIEENREIILTDVGLDIINAEDNKLLIEKMLERQIIRYQYPSPNLDITYENGFKGIFPHIFLLQILFYCDNFISFEEYMLFVNLAQSHEDLHRIEKYIIHWRSLSEDEQNQLLSIVKTIPLKNPLINKTDMPLRYTIIKRDNSYSRSLFGFPNYLVLDKKEAKIKILNPDTVANILNSSQNQKLMSFTTLEDWFSYFGDPLQQPSWFNYLVSQIERAETIEEVEEIIQENQKNLSREENEELKYKQIEKSIETFYVENLNLLENGLQLVENGRQYATPIGRIDLLCKGLDNKYVVIEVKVDEAKDSVFGQILRYIGWIHRNLPDGKDNVRGIILAGQFTDKARYSRIGLLKEDVKEFLQFRKHNLNVSNIE